MGAEGKIYRNISDIPPKNPGTTRVLTGGLFDGIRDVHPGHVAFINALADPLGHKPLFVETESSSLKELDRFTDSPVELLIGVVADSELAPLARSNRPIVPQNVRIDRIASVRGVSGAFPFKGNLKEAAEVLKPDAVGFSLTSSNFYGEYHSKVREGVVGLGILSLVLPKLVPISTTATVEDFFLKSDQISQFNIYFSKGGREINFPLLYSQDLVLTPDQASVDVARHVARAELAKRTNLRALELGVGSGIFGSSLILNSEPDQFKKVDSVDIDEVALGIARFNMTRAGMFKDIYPALNFQKSDWFTEVKGSYDFIYLNPPFFTSVNNYPPGFEGNPTQAIFSPTPEYHYQKIFSRLIEHIHSGSVVTLRVPRDQGKTQRIKNVISQNVNLNIVQMEDFSMTGGRFITLRF